MAHDDPPADFRPTHRARQTAPIAASRRQVLRRYGLAIVLGNLVWEFAQLPLYTIWNEGTPSEIAFAALHCTVGDFIIASIALLLALVVADRGHWPHVSYRKVAMIAVLGGLTFTVLSEWLNTEVWRNWAYTASMPTLPLIGTGLSPFLQWVVVPLAAFWWACRPFVQGTKEKEKLS